MEVAKLGLYGRRDHPALFGRWEIHLHGEPMKQPFLRANYQDPTPETLLEQLNVAHAKIRWQKLQIRLLSVGVIFAYEPILERLKVWAWHRLFQ